MGKIRETHQGRSWKPMWEVWLVQEVQWAAEGAYGFRQRVQVLVEF